MLKNKNGVIEDKEWIDYKKRFADFMQEMNPKPTLADIDELKQKKLDARVNK